MSLPPFSFPFAHWSPQTISVSTPSTVTVSRFIQTRLLLGLSSGEIAIFGFKGSTTPCLQARLLGHQASVISLEYLETVSETSATDPVFLSLSADGALSKWSLTDNRCLRSTTTSTAARAHPQGMVVVPRSGLGEGRLTDGIILVYGCDTEVVVINSESLETVFVWSGHVDWPVPLATGKKGDEGEKECEVATVFLNGDVQKWTLMRRSQQKPTGVLMVRRNDEGKRWKFDTRGKLGRVIGWHKVAGGYLVVQKFGVGFHVEAEQNFVKKCEQTVGESILGAEIFGRDRDVVVIKTENSNVRVYRVKIDQLEALSRFRRPEFLRDEKITDMAVFFDNECQNGKLAILSRPNIQNEGLATPSDRWLDISIAEITRDSERLTTLDWDEKVLTRFRHLGNKVAPSTCSEIFCNMLALARRSDIDLYSMSSFLLNFHEPTTTISIPCENSTISLLKRVRVGEHIGSGRGSGIIEGKEYLVAGTQSGDVFIIDSPSYQPSKRLPLFPSPVKTAHVLPANLGRRLRSTLLVSSFDGTVSIIDIERAHVMVTFPSHNYSSLQSFATKLGMNLVALTYQDGVRREWDMGDEEGGVLLNPPPSGGSTAFPHSVIAGADDKHNGHVTDEDSVQWRVANILELEPDSDDIDDIVDSDNGDGTLQLWDGFCRLGLPTAAVNVRAVLEMLENATKMAMQRPRQSEWRVVSNHPAIVNAKSLLTALAPGGTNDLFLTEDKAEDEDQMQADNVYWRDTVSQFFFHRKNPVTVGQIGAARRISLFTPDLASSEGGDISPTMTSIKLLAIATLVSALLRATGKKNLIDTVFEKMLHSHLGRKQVALGVFAKFWSDANPLIRWVARGCLDAFMSALAEFERGALVAYWKDYLPVHVPPELSSAKEVARSTILLGKLITDYDQGYDDSLKKSIANSAFLLLHEANPICQDAAVEIIGYSWTPFQTYFDPFLVLHTLILLPFSPTLLRTLLQIATKNTPLLISSIANNIVHGTPPPTPSPFPTGASSHIKTSAAALHVATKITLLDPILFRPFLSPLVIAIVKLLDPMNPPSMREKLLPAITTLVDALVAEHPTLAFHRPTQRLALSSAPRSITVYDLKTAGVVHVLEGHQGWATALGFSEDGKWIATVDSGKSDGVVAEGRGLGVGVGEGELLVWRFVGGFLSFIGNAATGESDRFLQPKARWALGLKDVEMIDCDINVEWSGEKQVRVMNKGKLVEVFNV